MRLLHVNDHDPASGFGGAEVYVGRLIAAQRERGHDVDVLCADSGSRSRLLDLWDRSALRRLRDRVEAFRPDIVHVHGFVRELSPSVLVQTGVPTVLTFHDLRLLGGSEHHLPDPRALAARLWVEPVALRLARRVAAVSGVSDVVTAALRAEGLPHPRTLPVPVGPPLTPPRPVSSCRDVLFAGRLSEDKGLAVLLRAFAALRAEHPDVRLLVAGDGPGRASLEAAAGTRVDFLGRISPVQVSEVMGRVRVVAVPSLPSLRREGSSLTTVEAARHGRPVVCSDDPAVAEVARHMGGDVVPAGDPDALARRLGHWLNDASDAERVGASGATAAAAVFDPHVVADLADALYTQAAR